MVEEKTVVRDQSPHPTGELGTLVTAGNADNTHTVTTKNRKFVRSDFGQIFTLNSWIGRAFRDYRYQPYV